MSSEIIQEYQALIDNGGDVSLIVKHAMELVPFFLKHNAEADACDLLIELERLKDLVPLVDKDTYQRVCLYIIGCAPFVTPPDDVIILKTAHDIYIKMKQYPSALQVSLQLNDLGLIKSDFNSCPDPYCLSNQDCKETIGIYFSTSTIISGNRRRGFARDSEQY